jgi:hypothetical protein
MGIFVKISLKFILSKFKKKGIKMLRITYDHDKAAMTLEIEFNDDTETLTLLASDIEFKSDGITFGQVTTTSKQGFVRLALFLSSITKLKFIKINPEIMIYIREIFKIVK